MTTDPADARDFAVEVCRALALAGDPERAAGQQAYMKSQLPFHGVTSAQLKALLGPLLADDALRPATREAWEATVRDLWDNATHREQRYAATALLAHRSARRWHDPDLLPLLRHLIVTGAWWDHVDDIATHHVAPILLRHRETVTPTMLAWARGGDPLGDDLWLRRTAIICQLPHKGATDVALLTAAIDANLETDARGERTAYGSSFWIRKAIGWALRQQARTDPQWTLDFVADHRDRMAGLSIREALKHLG
ncbi:MAG: DNA alkylation repair protein [Phycicoccus sp.]|uniref:DNA alkylation repair protein n=1 Tax=Phycicoccus sp. TaxID=1902410 RepID=UPI00258FA894|nr:DNA alkylation repair protein [Phycicoccus sp.]MCO5303902.1 DNA alkylation repair protein [Phycicoccus sp.]